MSKIGISSIALLPRRPDLRGGRPRRRAGRAPLHGHPVADRRHRPAPSSQARRSSATRAPIRKQHGLPLPALRRGGRRSRPPTRSCCRRAASTSGAATASSTCGSPRRSPSLQRAAREPAVSLNGTGNGDGPRPSYEEFSRRVNDENASRGLLRGLLRLREAARAGRPRRRRAEQGDPAALHHRCDEPRRPLARGPRDAGDRDEPHRRQVEQRRGRRGQPPQHARPERRPRASRGSARSRRAASASTSTSSPTPTSCRSRSPRARSPARAASSPATRSTTTSPSCATGRPASS